MTCSWLTPIRISFFWMLRKKIQKFKGSVLTGVSVILSMAYIIVKLCSKTSNAPRNVPRRCNNKSWERFSNNHRKSGFAGFGLGPTKLSSALYLQKHCKNSFDEFIKLSVTSQEHHISRTAPRGACPDKCDCRNCRNLYEHLIYVCNDSHEMSG